MGDAEGPNATVRFGVFEVNLRSGELRKSGIRIRLQEQPFRVLIALLERSGEVVSREELQIRIWPKESFGDFEHAVNVAVAKLRTALGDSADAPRYVETLHRRGYRFIFPIGGLNRPDARIVGADSGLPAASVCGPLQALDQKAEKLRLIVLPFENLGRDPEHEYFNDGLTEEMITQIGRLDPARLGVIARSTTMRYKNIGKSIKDIGHELRVHYILEGGVRRAADRVRVSVRLIQVSDETNLWAETYERSLADVLKLQTEIAQATAKEIRLTLTREQQLHLGPARLVDPEACDAYFKGRYCWNRRSEEGLAKAIDYFKQAISRDPEFAAAYSGLADAYSVLGTYGALSPKDAFLPAKAAAGKALEIDDTLAEAHTSLAWASFLFDWNWPVAESEFERAIELNPNYPTAHFWRGVYLTTIGRISEALGEVHRAQELDPLSLPVVAIWGWIFCLARQYDQAIEQSKKALNLDPNYALAHGYLGKALLQKGMCNEAIAEFRKGFALSGGGTVHLAHMGHAYAVADEKHKAEEVLHELKNLSRRRYVSGLEVALVYAGLRDKRAAFAWLQKAYDERAPLPLFLKMDPVLDSLRSDLHFRNLLLRLNFPS
ncbi:MAG TPA: tetratricopeptide repeat protein [Candidatus Acidoferrum sp.]|jgi:TolB-like protein/DNA-binding winged helix-turn-helix (wHTH) protein/Flp pilus assembly protein TadD